jgi:hypothetical protein
MKTSTPQKPEPEAIERIVDDLSQQDVLPSNEGDATMSADDELIDAGEQAGSWNEPAGGVGHQMKRTPLEDETKAAEVLVQRGVNEAADELDELQEDETSPEEAA